MDSEPAPVNVLSGIRDLAFVVAIYLFFAGYVYDYYYREILNLPEVSDVSKELYRSFVLGYQVFVDQWEHPTVESVSLGLVTILFVIAAASSPFWSTYLARLSPFWFKWAPQFTRLFSVVVAIVLFPVIARESYLAAINELSYVTNTQDRGAAAMVLPLFTDDSKKYLSEAARVQFQNSRLLMETRDAYYFLVPLGHDYRVWRIDHALITVLNTTVPEIPK